MRLAPNEVQSIRARLGVSQGELATWLGVHAITVSRWERGALLPTTYQSTLLRAFGSAAERAPDVGRRAVAATVADGVPSALFILFEAHARG